MNRVLRIRLVAITRMRWWDLRWWSRLPLIGLTGMSLIAIEVDLYIRFGDHRSIQRAACILRLTGASSPSERGGIISNDLLLLICNQLLHYTSQSKSCAYELAAYTNASLAPFLLKR